MAIIVLMYFVLSVWDCALEVNIPSLSLNQLLRRWETGGWWDWGRGSFRHWRRTRDQERTEPANTIHVCIYTGAAFVQTHICTPHMHAQGEIKVTHSHTRIHTQPYHKCMIITWIFSRIDRDKHRKGKWWIVRIISDGYMYLKPTEGS